MWKATAPQINRWRKKVLHLKSTDMSHMSQTKIPMLYNFSSAVVPKPLDWHDDITITGYWNLENSDTDWSPPDDMEEFMRKAKSDGKPLVYIVRCARKVSQSFYSVLSHGFVPARRVLAPSSFLTLMSSRATPLRLFKSRMSGRLLPKGGRVAVKALRKKANKSSFRPRSTRSTRSRTDGFSRG